MEKLTTKNSIQPYNKQSGKPMLYKVDVMGWEKDKPLVVSESEKDVIEQSLASGSFVKLGDNLVNPNMIRFIKPTEEDKRKNVRYEMDEERGVMMEIPLE